MVGYVVGTLVGTLLASVGNRAVDGLAVVVTSLVASVPVYALAGLLYIVLAGNLGVTPLSLRRQLPTGHADQLVVAPFLGALDGTVGASLTLLWYVTLPVLCWVPAWAESALAIRDRARQVGGGARVRGARLRGIRGRGVRWTHVARPSVLSTPGDLRATVATVAGGMIVIAPVFVYPGLGGSVYYGLLKGYYGVVVAGVCLLTVVSAVLAAVAERITSLLGLRPPRE